MKKPIRGIFFDIGWTLLFPPSGDWMFSKKAIELCSRKQPPPYTADEWKDAAAICMRELMGDHLVRTVEQEYAQFHRFYKSFSALLPNLGLTDGQIDEIAYEKVYDDSIYTFFDDTESTLKQLAGTYRLGVISDTWPSIARVLKNAGLLDFFDTVTFSCDLGVCKPGRAIYEDALRKMGLPPAETLFIDDGIGNLRAAKKLGIQPVLITASPAAVPTDEVVCIERIGQLPDILF